MIPVYKERLRQRYIRQMIAEFTVAAFLLGAIAGVILYAVFS